MGFIVTSQMYYCNFLKFTPYSPHHSFSLLSSVPFLTSDGLASALSLHIQI